MPLRQYRAECSLAGVGEGGSGSGTVPHVNDLVCFDPRPRSAESLRRREEEYRAGARVMSKGEGWVRAGD